MRVILLSAMLSCVGANAQNLKSDAPILKPQAVLGTDPVPHRGDAADDPAIWHHPTDPAKSLIIGTDKQGGLISYDVDGKQIQIVSEKSRPDNVDVLYDFPLDGKPTDVAVAGCRGSSSSGIKIWSIDRETRQLNDITAGGVIRVFNHTSLYGTCVYRSRKTGRFYAFAANKKGEVEQYELKANPAGKVNGTLVRSFGVSSVTEGCTADDDHGFFYVGEESTGIWKFDAEPDGSKEGKLIARVGECGLKPDVEGLTIYRAGGGKGYLIASSQGNNTYKIYDRTGDNAYIATIDPVRGILNKPMDTDGICVTSAPLGPRFPKGAFIVQDGHNKGANQNFKLFRWDDIAGDRLMIDTSVDPRK